MIVRRLGPVALLAVLAACGGGSKNPSTPSTPQTQPPAAPTPTPVPSALPVYSQSCVRQGYVDGKVNDCGRTVPSYLDILDASMEKISRERPDLVDYGSGTNGGYHVKNDGLFYVELIKELDTKGLCSDFDGGEFQIKASNAFNDQYQVISSTGNLRRGPISYRATCNPTAFPTPPAPPFPESATCGIAPSREFMCDRNAPSFQQQMEDAIDQVMKEQPHLFDFNRIRAGIPGGQYITDLPAYTAAVAKAMKKNGICTRVDGFEIQVKTQNSFSDQYKPSYGDQEGNPYVKRSDGMYRATCNPAAF